MGHRLDVGDVIDMLEESAMMRRPVVVQLSDGRIFEDRVKEIIKWEGEDQVVFKDHELTRLSNISSVQRARPPELTYSGQRARGTPRTV
ncbi:MAG TPA: hypothetical protein VL326_18470 [Kofleriaceae bacterium]|jgi:hypothetical protein|nr:hypothetical protein [Kofleriaceae bacterium]